MIEGFGNGLACEGVEKGCCPLMDGVGARGSEELLGKGL